MTRMPPPPMAYSPLQPGPRPVNAWAIVSLVCGIIGCFLVTPLVAIVTGVIGLGKVREQGGRGMAITGIILGVLWCVGLVGVGGATYWGVNKVAAMIKQPAIDAINALVEGDLTKAQSLTTLKEDDLRELSDRLKTYGKCTNLSLNSFNKQSGSGPGVISASGTATFDKAGEKNFNVTAKQNGQALAVTELHVD